MAARIQEADFDLAHEITTLIAGNLSVGGVGSFIGTVRGQNDGETISALTLEHYPGMTEQELIRIEAEARARWPLLGVTIIHRIGRLVPGDNIVLVLVTSQHRHAACQACEFIMDYLKTDAPFWKSEELEDGTVRWIEPRETDDAAKQRWSK